VSEILLTVEFATIVCSDCASIFAVTTKFQAERRASHKTFYCPNGHSQYYPGKTEADKFREAANEAQAQANAARHALAVKEKELRELAEAKRKLEERISAGVCPCCNRTFANLHRHMATKHPDRAVGAGKQRKAIAEAAR